MGRYTTVQSYSDNNPRNVQVTYEQAKGEGRIKVDKVDNVAGSTAGAGSGEFHMYRAHRRLEMQRLAKMSTDAEEDERRDKLEAARTGKQALCEEKTRKNAEKRKRRKK
ncbi:unnamed protein product, partial [Phaeothamnion confervicola]